MFLLSFYFKTIFSSLALRGGVARVTEGGVAKTQKSYRNRVWPLYLSMLLKRGRGTSLVKTNRYHNTESHCIALNQSYCRDHWSLFDLKVRFIKFSWCCITRSHMARYLQAPFWLINQTKEYKNKSR